MSIPDVDADPEVVLPAHKNLLSGGRIINYEHQLKRKDGRIITVLNNSRALIDSNGKVVGMQSTLVDVTMRKQAEEVSKRRGAILEAIAYSANRLLKASSWQDVIPETLNHLGNATEMDRIYIFQNSKDREGALLANQRYVWSSDSVTPENDESPQKALPFQEAGLNRWVKKMKKNQPIYGLVKTFPKPEKQMLEQLDIKSLIALPIFIDEKWWGFICFDDC